MEKVLFVMGIALSLVVFPRAGLASDCKYFGNQAVQRFDNARTNYNTNMRLWESDLVEIASKPKKYFCPSLIQFHDRYASGVMGQSDWALNLLSTAEQKGCGPKQLRTLRQNRAKILDSLEKYYQPRYEIIWNLLVETNCSSEATRWTK